MRADPIVSYTPSEGDAKLMDVYIDYPQDRDREGLLCSRGRG